MNLPVMVDRLQHLLGFPAVPGTLNVHLPEPVVRTHWQYLPATEISPAWEHETGQAGYFVAPILIGDRYRGLAFQADEPGYPVKQVELVCEVHIRTVLGLRDGDSISFSVIIPGQTDHG